MSQHRPFRFVVFPERPDALLVYAPEGSPPHLTIPPLPAPFTKAGVAGALGAAGHDVRVTEEVPGRWIHALQRVQRDEAAERRSVNRTREAVEALAARSSNDVTERERGELLQKKLEVDKKITELRNCISAGKPKRGRSAMAGHLIGVFEQDLETAKSESQAIQAQLSVLKQRRAEEYIKERASFERRFIAAAKEMLDEEEFQALVDEANGVEDGDG